MNKFDEEQQDSSATNPAEIEYGSSVAMWHALRQGRHPTKPGFFARPGGHILGFERVGAGRRRVEAEDGANDD